MRVTGLCYALCALLPHTVCALLEEKFVDFISGNASLDIARATILADAGESVGVHIAVKSLVDDFEQITGTRPLSLNHTNNSTFSNLTNYIVVGSVSSTLIRELSARGVFDISDIQGKWEVFKTAVVEKPFDGVDRALVIAGSDKRGTIFGIHTLAEQSGQSP
jgi:hypothetical protein